jgi:thioesterase domain-containing protein
MGTDERLRRLEATLHQQIPLSRAMQVRSVAYGPSGLTLAAPLAPNRNHAASAFAGSLNALLTLAGWGLLGLLLEEAQIRASVVIQDSSIRYVRPVGADLMARCGMPAPAELARFLAALRRRGAARIALEAQIGPDDAPAVQLSGRYVATRSADGW